MAFLFIAGQLLLYCYIYGAMIRIRESCIEILGKMWKM